MGSGDALQRGQMVQSISTLTPQLAQVGATGSCGFMLRVPADRGVENTVYYLWRRPAIAI